MNNSQMLVLDERAMGNPTVFALVVDIEGGRYVETMLGNPAECENLLLQHIDPTDLHGALPWACAYFGNDDQLYVKGNNVIAKQAAVELIDAYVQNDSYVAAVLEVDKPRSTMPLVRKARRPWSIRPFVRS